MSQFFIPDTKIAYTVRESSRAKNLRLSIRHDGSVTVTRPRYVSDKQTIFFVEQHTDWIKKKLEKFKHYPADFTRHDREHYLEHVETARKLVHEKLTYWNKFYNFSYGTVAIRSQKTKWGSCSSRKNLNFNYRIIFLSTELQDYLVVHELCHLQEMNHGSNFWKLVEKTIPDAKILQKKINFRID